MRTRPLAIAHRGNSCNAPENTLAAFQQAIDIGVDLIELDVTHTSDGQPVIFHGPDLQKTAGVEGSIHDITLKEARGLDIGSWKDPQYADQRILTLPEVLEFTKNRVHLAVDLKTFDIIPEIVRFIQDANMVDAVAICGCYILQARLVRACDQRLTVGLNVDAELEKLARMEDRATFNQAYVHQAAHNNLHPLNVHYRYVTPELIRLARLRAIPVWAWTVDEPEDMRHLIHLGVDAIYSNYPQRLCQVLDNLEEKP